MRALRAYWRWSDRLLDGMVSWIVGHSNRSTVALVAYFEAIVWAAA